MFNVRPLLFALSQGCLDGAVASNDDPLRSLYSAAAQCRTVRPQDVHDADGGRSEDQFTRRRHAQCAAGACAGPWRTAAGCREASSAR